MSELIHVTSRSSFPKVAAIWQFKSDNEARTYIFGKIHLSNWLICVLPLFLWHSMYKTIPTRGSNSGVSDKALRGHFGSNDICRCQKLLSKEGLEIGQYHILR